MKSKLLDIAFGFAIVTALSMLCAVAIEGASWAVLQVVPLHELPARQAHAIYFWVLVAGSFVVLGAFVLLMSAVGKPKRVQPRAYRVRGRSRPSPQPQIPEDERRAVSAKLIERVHEAERRQRETQAQLERARNVKEAPAGGAADVDEEEMDEAPELEDWHITDLAEVHRTLHTAGLLEARNRIERVLEDIEPAWRLYA
jgi:hypothetical protein